jgi:hypothetical protein
MYIGFQVMHFCCEQCDMILSPWKKLAQWLELPFKYIAIVYGFLEENLSRPFFLCVVVMLVGVYWQHLQTDQ